MNSPSCMRKIVVAATFSTICSLNAHLDKKDMEYARTKPKALQGEFYGITYEGDCDVMVCIMEYLYYHERQYELHIEHNMPQG